MAEDQDSSVRRQALREVAYTAPDQSSSASQLGDIALHGDFSLRGPATAALAYHHSDQRATIDLLRILSRDGVAEVRRIALAWWAALTPNAPEALAAVVRAARSDPDPLTRATALRQAALLLPPVESGALLRNRAENDEASRVRSHALSALAHLDEPGLTDLALTCAGREFLGSSRRDALRLSVIAARANAQDRPAFLSRVAAIQSARLRRQTYAELAARARDLPD
nr:hypothetical protein [Micromonospora sp. DSM 115978]